MIGYPEWMEDPEKLDKYYENVSFYLTGYQFFMRPSSYWSWNSS